MKKILFISHEASLTGAPILLLNFIRWFKQHSDQPFTILIRRDGPLKTKFEELGSTFIYEDFFKYKGIKNLVWRRILRMISQDANPLKKQFSNQNICLVFSNTLTNGDIIKKLDLGEIKIITYAHELDVVIKNFASRLNFDIVLNRTAFYLTGSEAVRQNLIQNYNVPLEKSQVVYSYISLSDFNNAVKHPSNLKYDLNIPENNIIIGGIGRGLWRKGIDLFLNVADVLINHEQQTDITFLWVGIDEGEEYNMILHDVERLNLKYKTLFIHAKENIKKYYNIFDLFLLTSREDPFPVVVVEAAAMRIPIICFNNAGGTPEFTSENCGITVPYLNSQEMARQVSLLLNSPEDRNLIKENAYLKVEKYHDIEYAGPIIKKCISDLIM